MSELNENKVNGKNDTQSFEKEKKTYKFFYWLLAGAARRLYRVRVINASNEPLDSHFIVACNHTGAADGVIICGCHPGDCHYTSGNYYTRRRMAALFSMLDYLGIERERTRVEWVSAAEGAKFAATMNDFAEKVAALGENKRLEDLRCKR